MNGGSFRKGLPMKTLLLAAGAAAVALSAGPTLAAKHQAVPPRPTVAEAQAADPLRPTRRLCEGLAEAAGDEGLVVEARPTSRPPTARPGPDTAGAGDLTPATGSQHEREFFGRHALAQPAGRHAQPVQHRSVPAGDPAGRQPAVHRSQPAGDDRAGRARRDHTAEIAAAGEPRKIQPGVPDTCTPPGSSRRHWPCRPPGVGWLPPWVGPDGGVAVDLDGSTNSDHPVRSRSCGSRAPCRFPRSYGRCLWSRKSRRWTAPPVL